MRSTVETVVSTALAVWFTFTLAFVLLRLVPTNALQARISDGELSAAEAARLYKDFGLDQPILVQYWTQLTGYLAGEWGRSLRTSQPVALFLAPRLSNTVELVSVVALLSITTTLGFTFLAFRSRVARLLVNATSSLSLAMPIYWTGLLTLVVIGGWFHLPQSSPVLPVIALTVHLSTQLSRMLLHLLDDAQHLSFVAYGRSKGLGATRLWVQYILRPTATTWVAILSSQAVVLLGGTVTVEALFSRPGIGTALVDAVVARDYPVAQGAIVLLMSLSFLIGLSSRLLSYAIDPRLRAA